MRNHPYNSTHEHGRIPENYHVIRVDDRDQAQGILSGRITELERPVYHHYHKGEIYECRTNPFYRSTAFALIKILETKKVSQNVRIRFKIVKRMRR